jgi:carboxylesterase type B
MTEAQYEAAVLAYASNDQTLANQVLALYPAASFASPLEAYIQVTTDAKFTSATTYDACVAAVGQSDDPVYRYFYTHHIDDSTAAVRALGAWHGQELGFLFGSLAEGSYKLSAGEQALTTALQTCWANMARSGTVGGSLPWPPYNPATAPYMQLDDTLQAGMGVRTSLMQFWSGVNGHTCP